MNITSNQSGSSHVVLLLLVVLVAVVGFVGYRVVDMQKTTSTPVSTAPVAQSQTASTPSAIKTKSDAKQAASSLDSDKIDQNLDPNQFDTELASIY